MHKLLCLALLSLAIYVQSCGCNAYLQQFNSSPDKHNLENGLKDVDSSEIMNKILINEPINYSYVNISGDLNYKEIDRPIKQKISITNSRVNGNINFAAATFENSVYFSNTTFMNNVYFGGTRFENGAYFLDAEFLGEAYFRYAKFMKNGFFLRDKFNITKFDYAQFDENAYFQYAKFGKMASFLSVRFKGSSFFNNAKFMDKSYFRDTFFSQNSYFDETRFKRYAFWGGAEFVSNAYFERSIFDNQADFSRTQFNKNAFFEGTKFLGNAFFSYARFGGDALFYDTTINKRINLSKAKFDRFYIEWDYIKSKLDYDGAAYLAFRKSYNDLEMFDSADQCYYEYRKKSQDLKPWGMSKIIDIVAWLSCGYGKKPSYTLAWIFIVIIGSGLLFGRSKSIVCESHFQGGNIALRDAFYFSLMTFIGASTEFKANGLYKYGVSIERIFGWLLLALFIVTLGSVFIR